MLLGPTKKASLRLNNLAGLMDFVARSVALSTLARSMMTTGSAFNARIVVSK
jgi:hypothetical protein